ncbi:MAG: DNA polymerase III subunit alpha [Flavobacteriaceae bacterium]|nr:DNA polymerase III subunit alpha [Flavobacteriaceae bacterium]
MANLSNSKRPLFLILDIETTGLSELKDVDLDHVNPLEWPRCVQIAWNLHDSSGKCIEDHDFIVKTDGFNIPLSAYNIHGISDELSQKEGFPIDQVLLELDKTIKKADFIVGHNIGFDIGGISSEYIRLGRSHPFKKHQLIDTCSHQTKQLCRIEGGRGKGFKFPKLEELHQFLFDEKITDSHNATRDVVATARCFFELLRTKNLTFSLTSELIDELTNQSMSLFPDFQESTHQILNNMALKIEQAFGGSVQNHHRKHENLRKKSEALKAQKKDSKRDVEYQETNLETINFIHLHVHSHYSLLQATSKFPELVSAAAADKMIALACTDIGYMTGIFEFLKTLHQHNNNPPNQKNPIKPIIGCELNVCRNHLDQTRKDNGYQMVFLAKTLHGYRNLSKLVSIARTKGFYYVPRIDRELLLKHKEDLIVLSGGSNGELYSNILNKGDHYAIEALKWWKQHFRDDFYIEINRQDNQEEQSLTNQTLVQLAQEYEVSIVACNNTFYTQKEDAELHEILLCIGQGTDLNTPIGHQRGMRFGFTHKEFYFKTQQEMKALFADIPQAILSTQEIANKIESFEIHRQVELPKFEIPADFASKNETLDQARLANQYLKHIAYQGAKKLYVDLTQEITERLDYELKVIANTGYPGYFLILSDLVHQAYKKGVDVGPGRGSAAGSIVAYCIGITKVDPLKYNLLFERFLNPDRISLPDIDIDFEDVGRSKVIDYLIEKYGANQVSQILTFSTLKAKNSILDVARVLSLPIRESRQLSDKIETFKLTLKERLTCRTDKLKEKEMSTSEIKSTQELRSIYKGSDTSARVLQLASRLEGTNRNLSTHACGVIIAPEEITNFVPITKIKDSDLIATQFDNNHVENAGLLKMDILGLTTLTSIKETIRHINKRYQDVDVDLENPPLDDQKTFKLFQEAMTNGVFQYESNGMKNALKDLKPTTFGDLVAVNALYRPGPMEYIPSFIARKQGKEEFVYDIPETEEVLKETYGITVYQEQVMLLSQELAGFTKGEADLLRKAMGKKEKAIIDKLKPKFLSGGKSRGLREEKLEKIWKDWESFARYAFNKSHSVSYALLGYKTAFLKAHYPAEFMAAIMTQNMSKPDKLTNYVIECQKFDVTVLGPDINESNRDFTVTDKQVIRFGLGGIKYLSSQAIEHILELRKEGSFESIFDFMERIKTKYCNKKSLTALICSGSFDSFETPHRAQYIEEDDQGVSLLDELMKYSERHDIGEASNQPSLFDFEEIGVIRPSIPAFKQWPRSQALLKEKAYISLYLSAHPLDDFEYEMKYFGGRHIKDFNNQINDLIGKPPFWISGIISDVFHRESKSGKNYAHFTLGDKTGNYSFAIFGEQYQVFHSYLAEGRFVRIQLQIQQQNSKNSNYSNEPRIHFHSFEPLDDVFAKKINRLEIDTLLQEIDVTTVQSMASVFKKTELGNTKLYFKITDREAKNSPSYVQLSSNNTPFLVNTALLKSLDSLKIAYTLG